MNKLIKKLEFLRRDETKYYSKASVAEAIDVLIECCEFIIHNQPERLNPKTSKEDMIVRTSDESGRDEPEAVCPPGDRS